MFSIINTKQECYKEKSKILIMKRRVTNPLTMASLVIIIFLTHPSHNSSNVHSNFFSIGGGFFNAVDCEYMIGVLLGLLLLVFLESDPILLFAVELASEKIPPSFDSDTSVLLLKFLDIGSLRNSKSELLLRFSSLDNEVGVVLLRLAFLDNDRGLGVVLRRLVFLDNDRGLGVGVLLLRLLLLEIVLDMFAKKLSSTL